MNSSFNLPPGCLAKDIDPVSIATDDIMEHACSVCGGSGVFANYEETSPGLFTLVEESCKVCAGLGVVNIRVARR